MTCSSPRPVSSNEPRPQAMIAAVLVGHEERGVRRRVVVVEQLEEEAEAAVRAALGLAAEARVALGLGRAACRSWGR